MDHSVFGETQKQEQHGNKYGLCSVGRGGSDLYYMSYRDVPPVCVKFQAGSRFLCRNVDFKVKFGVDVFGIFLEKPAF